MMRLILQCKLRQLLPYNSYYITSALTDPLISGIANGSTAYKLVGTYVVSPLKWYEVLGFHHPDAYH